MRTVLIVAAASLLLATAVHAQESARRPQSLKTATIVFASAAVADWVTTYRAQTLGAQEGNPLLRGLSGHPAALVATGAAIDVGAVWAWNRHVGKRHPRLAKIGLFAAAGVRTWIAIRNVQANPVCHARVPEVCH